MDLTAATDQLYDGQFDDFIDRRKALVAEARAAKDRPLATAIGKLRKPTRSAWLVNLLARQADDELGALLDLGAALQAAQEQLSVADLRRLSGERQKTLAAATRRAVALGDDRGYTATEAVRQEVTQTLQAALADPDVAELVRAGTVTEAHTYGGFGVFGLAAPGPAPEEAAESADEVAEDEELRAEREQQLHEAEAALSTAADEADDASARADELAERVQTLRAELAEAERAEAEARDRAGAARATVAAHQSAVEAARTAYEAL